MTLDVKIAGSRLTPGDRQYWVVEGTVVEDATGLSLADTFGGVGSVNVVTDLLDNTTLTQGTDLELDFGASGARTAIIQSIQSTDRASATISGETKKTRLNRVIQAKVVKTTVGAALAQYFGKCGLAPSEYSIDAAVAARPALLPGWEGRAWGRIKELCAVEQVDIDDVDGVIVVRPMGAITFSGSEPTGISASLSENIRGRFVETHLYDYTAITNSIVYPPAEYDSENGGTIPAGWRPEYEVIEVTPGEPVEFDVPLLASLTSVKQPVPVELVGPEYAGPNSVYTVVTNDGVQAIDPSVWTARGGKVTVEILPDTQTLRVRVDAGRNLIDLAPYRLALTSGGGRDYSTLRIVGTGISFTKTSMRLRTSVPASLTDQDIASSSDSVFCRTQTQARRQLRTQARLASRSIGEMSTSVSRVANPFGERAGAIIRTPEVNWRIRTATTNSSSTQIEADRHTTIADFNAAWAGKTIADFNAVWAGYQMRHFNSAPLRTSLPTAPTYPSVLGYGEGLYGEGGYGG